MKDALITASSYHSNSRHTSLGRVFPDTKGILFFGTPHRGSSKESLGEIVASVSKLCLHKPNQQLLRTLREDSHILERQRNEFTTISQGISVICVREELPTAIGVVCTTMDLYWLTRRLADTGEDCFKGVGDIRRIQRSAELNPL